MRRTILGWLVMLHGLAHAAVAVWSAATGPLWLVTALWLAASAGFMCVGLGLLRVPWLRDRWKPTMVAASVASMLLLMTYRDVYSLAGVIVDLALFFALLQWSQRRIDADVDVIDSIGTKAVSRHPALLRTGWVIGAAFAVYAAGVMIVRPVYLRWGTTSQEREGRLPGDDSEAPAAGYRVDHAITIHAPADTVWEWLAQIGQDRAGFYSYDWLERAIGDDIHNSDTLHLEWRLRGVGDTVYAVQPHYLGMSGRAGWRITRFERGRVLGLENWGNFVLEPIDAATTRLIIRTRGAGTKSFAAFVLAPASVFVFEPAHFIMQRRMMRGIRDRAERMAAPQRGE